MKIYLGYGKYKIICDKCGEVIIYDDNGDEELSCKYKDLNNGHECSQCKRNRERKYDSTVDPLNFYH